MGFFDYQCSASGLSLLSERAVLVLLLESEPGRWGPVSLALRGDYDRYGTIENVKPDFRTAFLASDFHQLAKSGRLLAGKFAVKELESFKQKPEIEKVIKLVERATTMGAYDADCDLTIDGKPVRQTLILRELFEAVIGKSGALPRPEPTAAAVTALVEQAFETDLGRWMARDLSKTTAQMRTAAFAALSELLAFRRWLEEKKLPWLPSRDARQHGTIHSLAFYAPARARFADDERLLKVIDAQARRHEKLEAEDPYYQLPEKWLRGSVQSWYGLAVGPNRIAATQLGSLRQAVETHVGEASANAVLAGGPEILAVQRGVVTQRIDLRPLIRLCQGSQRVTLLEPTARALAVAGAQVELNWDEIETQLSPLQAPLARGDSALFPLMLNGPTGPAWAQEDEEHRDSIARFRLSAPR